jgi:hypothetical protein
LSIQQSTAKQAQLIFQNRCILVSLDRHEVYINCANIDRHYVDYVMNHPRRRTELEPILKMHKFRPYWINHDTYVRKLSILLLAVMMK